MSSSLKNLSDFSHTQIPVVKGKRVVVVTSEWNASITGALREACIATLLSHGFEETNIIDVHVPGSFELIQGAQQYIQNADAAICLGCVIQGETLHFDFICDAVAHGCINLSLKYNKPVVFGVLTPDTEQQAFDRAGGKHGNKGVEAAVTALKMLALS
jgi:6,7-dimethyl-8-ribityllumazine synthase